MNAYFEHGQFLLMKELQGSQEQQKAVNAPIANGFVSAQPAPLPRRPIYGGAISSKQSLLAAQSSSQQPSSTTSNSASVSHERFLELDTNRTR
jgi:hypothetical protein